MELQIHLSPNPVQELKSFSNNLSESQFVDLTEKYVKKYGIISSKPLLIDRNSYRL